MMADNQTARVRDLYEVLHVDRFASTEEIRKSYRKLARENHPDMHPDDEAYYSEKIKEINEAYEVLGDPSRRSHYDATGETEGGSAFGAGMWGTPDDFNNAFNEAFSGRSPYTGSTAGHRVVEERGADISVNARVTLEQATFGCTTTVEYMKEDRCPKCAGTGSENRIAPQKCPECGGMGYVERTIRRAMNMPVTTPHKCHVCGGRGVIVQYPCSNCNATGHSRQRKSVSVAIPAGIEEGQVLVLAGAGNIGVNGGPAGDLRVTVHILEHDSFQREGTNVRSIHTISFYQAATGCTINVPTLTGNARVRLHPGTQNGEEFVIESAGIPDLVTHTNGDHIVTIHVEVPTHMNAKQRELLKQWAIAMSEDVSEDQK